jgi:hypothetical protein
MPPGEQIPDIWRDMKSNSIRGSMAGQDYLGIPLCHEAGERVKYATAKCIQGVRKPYGTLHRLKERLITIEHSGIDK